MFSMGIGPERTAQGLHLDEAGVLEDLVRVTDEFQLLHHGHRLVQVQDHTSGCDAEVGLETGNRVIAATDLRVTLISAASELKASETHFDSRDRLQSQESCSLRCDWS